MTTDKLCPEKFYSRGLKLDEMNYIHPKYYQGTGTWNTAQERARCRVEFYCLACDKFMGKEHDFSECEDCIKFDTPFPLINTKDFVRLSAESEVSDDETE